MGKDFLNATAPLNFHNITIMGGANGGRGGSHNPPSSAVGGTRINLNGGAQAAQFSQTQTHMMKLADHIQHGGEPSAPIGGGGFAFY